MMKIVSVMVRTWIVLACLLAGEQDTGGAEENSRFRVPEGCVVEQIAAAPLVRFPMFACLDDQGRLYVAEGSGQNVPGTELEKTLPCKITLLEDLNGDGKYDKATAYAEQLIFPAGVLWHNGRVYVASPPGIHMFEDTDGDGTADRHEVIVSGFKHDGSGHDVHGPFLGIDGWLYWTDGLRDYDVKTREGKTLRGRAALIWRCRTDGQDVEWLCGGGIDNPVELLFLPDGTLIGTMDQTPGDAILHYVDGGWYPSLHDDRVGELPNTGPQLGSIAQFSAALPAALCGFCRLETDHFGPERLGSLITTQFNLHRMQQHGLARDGSTYRSSTADFLISADYDVRPTDVLEDADGSLIWIDMGAWYNYECPTAKIAKPESLGSIYRIRNTQAQPAGDVWGNAILWSSEPTVNLVKLLEDPRPKVRDMATAELIRRQSRTVSPLAGELENPKTSPGLRGRIVSVLTQIGTAEARQSVRAALADPAAEVRQLAAHCVGVERDVAAFAALTELVVNDEPAVRLEAAEALGRLGRSEAIGFLQTSLADCRADRFLEHALIYALIQLDAPQQTTPLLADPNPDVRRAGLIALDQMPGAKLDRETVLPLLNTEDPDLKQTVLEVISARGQWSVEILSFIFDAINAQSLNTRQQQTLAGALLSHAGNREVQQLVSAALQDRAIIQPTRRLLLEFIGQCNHIPLPEEWREVLRYGLADPDLEIQRAALGVMQRRNSAEFAEDLSALARREQAPTEHRMIALACVAPAWQPLPAWAFDFLTNQLHGQSEPLARMTAAQVLGSSFCSDEQLLRLADILTNQGPLVVPALAPVFKRSRGREIGLSLVGALKVAPGASALTIDDLDKLLSRYPPEVRQAARPLREQRASALAQQEAELAGLTSQLLAHPGDAARGREVFFSKKVGCYSCHRVGAEGGHVGPDLSFIGKFRRTVDLLEAIAVPSSSIVPGYRTYTIATTDGTVHSGLIARQSANAVFLRTPQLAEMRIARDEIAAIKPSPVSAMPAGLVKSMTPQEFSDLMEFLYRLR